MTLIIGGEAQGKRTCASGLAGSEPVTADCAVCQPEDIMSAALIVNYHELVKRFPDSAEMLTRRLCTENPGAVITLAEIGCGIIPVSREERIYRETAGRCGYILAENSEQVIRMLCGIACRIK